MQPVFHNLHLSLETMKLSVYSETEETLIDQCRQGHRQAQRDLYNRYSGTMLAVCSRYLSEKEAAEDVMIGAFMKVFTKIDQFKNEGSFEGWIRRIMVNEALTYIRKNKQMYLQTDLEEAYREPDYAILDNHLHAEDLMKLIAQLPVGYRTVFNMYAIEGFSHKEIAEAMGISENTSKSQLSRARALLQKHLLKREEAINNI
jgi:RNA polymerase sigma-70 factor (ECF subfamily)